MSSLVADGPAGPERGRLSAVSRLPACLARRLAEAQRRRWLVRLRFTDCTVLVGRVVSLDLRMAQCGLHSPGALWSDREVDLGGLIEVEALTASLLDPTAARHEAHRVLARLILVLGWLDAATPDILVCDLQRGDLPADGCGDLLLPDGRRVAGRLVERTADRCRFAIRTSGRGVAERPEPGAALRASPGA